MKRRNLRESRGMRARACAIAQWSRKRARRLREPRNSTTANAPRAATRSYVRFARVERSRLVGAAPLVRGRVSAVRVVSRDLDDDDFSIDVYNDGGANCGTGVFHADDGAVLSPSYAVGGTPAIFLRATRARRCFSTARDQALTLTLYRWLAQGKSAPVLSSSRFLGRSRGSSCARHGVLPSAAMRRVIMWRFGRDVTSYLSIDSSRSSGSALARARPETQIRVRGVEGDAISQAKSCRALRDWLDSICTAFAFIPSDNGVLFRSALGAHSAGFE